MEQPKKDPSASERQDEETSTTPEDPTNMQMYRWKDDGGAVPPEPDLEPKPKPNDES